MASSHGDNIFFIKGASAAPCPAAGDLVQNPCTLCTKAAPLETHPDVTRLTTFRPRRADAAILPLLYAIETIATRSSVTPG